MSAYDEMFSQMNKMLIKKLEAVTEECTIGLDRIINFKVESHNSLKQVENCNKPILPKTPAKGKTAKKQATMILSEEEEMSTSTSSKPKRYASKLAQIKINELSQQKLNRKLRRPTNESVLGEISNKTNIFNIKTEKTDEEVEDLKPIPKPKRTRKKVKKEAQKKSNEDSVIIQEVPVPIVVIDSQSEDENTKQSEQEKENEEEKVMSNLEEKVQDEFNEKSIHNLMTDDKNPKKTAKKTSKTKRNSPNLTSPVQKRIVEFEKIIHDGIPARVTRSISKQLNEKTPQMPLNKIPSSSQTDGKLNRNVKQSSKIAELQIRREEEQKKRLMKEEEVKRKRVALIQAKAEEQRRKREEKQMKAQKIREEIEREKEQRKRDWKAKKMAQIEEQKKVIKLREQERQELLKSKPPPLPTGDCSDSDSSTERNRRITYQKPLWAESRNLIPTLLSQRVVPKCYMKSLFQMKATTPNLEEIFETIDKNQLVRNSSAVWQTPVRYSQIPKF